MCECVCMSVCVCLPLPIYSNISKLLATGWVRVTIRSSRSDGEIEVYIK